MNDEPKGEIQIYQYFSDCLKQFKKRMIILCKITNFDQDQPNSHIQSSLRQSINEGNLLLQKFAQFQHTNQLTLVFSRFMLRIRESLHNLAMKTSNTQILQFLTSLDTLAKQWNSCDNVRSILSFVLIKIPKTKMFLNKIIYDTVRIQKNSIEQQQSDESIKQKKEDKIVSYKGSFDKYLLGLDREYRFYNCLGIDEPELRRNFFLALEDMRKRDNNLFEEMMYRNRMAKESLMLYEKKYENSKNKVVKKARLLKTAQKASRDQFNSKLSQKRNSSSDIKGNPNSLNITHQKRFKSQTDSRYEGPNNKIPLIFDGIKSISSKKPLTFKQRAKSNNPALSNSFLNLNQELLIRKKMIESDTNIDKFRLTNIFEMKKVQFKGNRIELAPEQTSKNSSQTTQQQKTKSFYKKTQEHFRKKASYLTQIKVNKAEESALKKTCNSIRLQFSKFAL